jgi:hypothetical protein
METDLNKFEAEIQEIHRDCRAATLSQEAYYRDDIDSLYFFMSDAPSHRKRVNRLLNVFVASDDGEIAGIEIKGWRLVLDNMRRFKVDHIAEQHPTLGLFLCVVMTSPEDGKEWIDSELTGLDKYSDVSLPKGLFETAS